MTYSEKLKDPRWQKKRLQVLNQHNFKCCYCGNEKETLHVHHYAYKVNPWDSNDFDLTVLCESCHSIEHLKDKMTQSERDIYDAVIIYNMVSSKIPIFLISKIKQIIFEKYGKKIK